ncbi:hypothetical protein NL676_025180 [Syzygium grande]|nr:hypothetical protein NL676_025180 [Syzygium grande]
MHGCGVSCCMLLEGRQKTCRNQYLDVAGDVHQGRMKWQQKPAKENSGCSEVVDHGVGQTVQERQPGSIFMAARPAGNSGLGIVLEGKPRDKEQEKTELS